MTQFITLKGLYPTTVKHLGKSLNQLKIFQRKELDWAIAVRQLKPIILQMRRLWFV